MPSIHHPLCSWHLSTVFPGARHHVGQVSRMITFNPHHSPSRSTLSSWLLHRWAKQRRGVVDGLAQDDKAGKWGLCLLWCWTGLKTPRFPWAQQSWVLNSRLQWQGSSEIWRFLRGGGAWSLWGFTVVQELAAAFPYLSSNPLEQKHQAPGASPDKSRLWLPVPGSSAPCVARGSAIQHLLQALCKTDFRPGEEKLETALYPHDTNLVVKTHPFAPSPSPPPPPPHFPSPKKNP